MAKKVSEPTRMPSGLLALAIAVALAGAFILGRYSGTSQGPAAPAPDLAPTAAALADQPPESSAAAEIPNSPAKPQPTKVVAKIAKPAPADAAPVGAVPAPADTPPAEHARNRWEALTPLVIDEELTSGPLLKQAAIDWGDKLTEAVVHRIDLNNDGSKEAIVLPWADELGAIRGASGNGMIYIYEEKGASWRLIGQSEGAAVAVDSTSSAGFNDLLIAYHSGGDDYELTRLRYDGETRQFELDLDNLPAR